MQVIPNTTNVEILTPDGFEPFAALYVSDPEDEVRLTLDDGTTKSVSNTHLFLHRGEPVLASSLKVGDSLDYIGTDKKSVKIKAIENRKNMVHMGPLSVHGHVYSTPEGMVHHNCQFVGSSTTLVASDVLDRLKPTDPNSFKYGYAMKIFEEPQPGAMYVMGVDSAAGSGKDYSVIQVLRVHARGKYEQAAIYRDNNIAAGKFANVVTQVAHFYNDAMSIIENNEIGKIVAEEAYYTCDYDGIISTDEHGIGTRATKSSKLEACNNLKEMMEKGELTLHDSDTIHELSIFEEVAPNVFKAPRNKHDDTVSALYWACYALIQPQIDLDDLSVTKTDNLLETPQTFWGDSTDTDEFDTSWAF